MAICRSPKGCSGLGVGRYSVLPAPILIAQPISRKFRPDLADRVGSCEIGSLALISALEKRDIVQLPALGAAFRARIRLIELWAGHETSPSSSSQNGLPPTMPSGTPKSRNMPSEGPRPGQKRKAPDERGREVHDELFFLDGGPTVFFL